jgi:hypothetical protein
VRLGEGLWTAHDHLGFLITAKSASVGAGWSPTSPGVRRGNRPLWSELCSTAARSARPAPAGTVRRKGGGRD